MGCCGNSPISTPRFLLTTKVRASMNEGVTSRKKPVVLLEMRPAFDGYAGIPQEVRLLFRGLRMLESVQVAGMMQLSHRILAKGTVAKNKLFNSVFMTQAHRLNRYSRVVISAAE